MPGDPSRFYAAFTTGASDGLIGSAICTYTMDDIQEAFAGRFKEQVRSYFQLAYSISLFTNSRWVIYYLLSKKTDVNSNFCISFA